MSEAITARLSWAGLATGPVAWGLNTQASYGISPWLCGSALRAVLIPAGLILLAIIGGAVSWYSAGAQVRSSELLGEDSGRPYLFVGGLSAILSIFCALAIAMQGAPDLILTGCER